VTTDVRIRREPPPLRGVRVRRVEARSPRLQRVTLAGEGLAGFEPGLPGGSVRLLLPPSSQSTSASRSELVLPTWNGNEYRYDDGTRPPIRTLTPLRFSVDDRELDIEVVLHGSGPLSAWAADAGPGTPAAVSGPGRGYEVDPDCRSFVLAGDESAIPALGLLVAALPAEADVSVIVEVADTSARLAFPARPGLTVTWREQARGAVPGDALADAVMAAPLVGDGRIWAAGEAAAMQRIRRHLFETVGIPRRSAVVRGYWKHGRAGGDDLD
jgi:NADPH-dependent ferric siderophore reductase